jgi:hypothetical protein
MKLRWPQRARFNCWPTLVLAAVLVLATNVGVCAQQSTEDLAAAAQNPVAAMHSLPFQNNIYGEGGPKHDSTANVLNIQPVIPITLGDWNLIIRTIAPLVYLPSLTTGASEIDEHSLFGGSHFGLGDINQSFYLSPAHVEGLIWGLGPSFNLPTATATPLGSAKFSLGPAAVALVMPKPWVIGTLVRQLFSVAGPANRPNVSQLLLQPIVNYNMEEGWYLLSSPIITGELASVTGQQVGFSPWRWHRQDFPDRRAADECLTAGFRLLPVCRLVDRDGPSAPNCNSCFRDSAAAVREMPFIVEI